MKVIGMLSGVDSVDGWAFVLPSDPRESYVTKVPSGKNPARVANPAAPIGEPIENSGASP